MVFCEILNEFHRWMKKKFVFLIAVEFLTFLIQLVAIFTGKCFEALQLLSVTVSLIREQH